MKKCVFLILTFFVVSGFGCATDQDLKRVRQNLTQEIITLQKNAEESRKLNKSLRKGQADISADMTDLRDDIQELRGMVEELRRNVLPGSKDKEYGEDIRKKLSAISSKINYIENSLGIEGKTETLEGSEKKGKVGITPTKTKKKTDKEATYAAAYKTFQEGKYDEARKEFQKFLKLFPKTEHSDNAQFWIGECYFFEKKYEKAILEYEKVIKDYPEGNKVSYALLKQGLSFLKIGDKSSAKLLLQQVIKDFPNTNQARIARAKLVKIK